jgi:uncharacterized membrane protein
MPILGYFFRLLVVVSALASFAGVAFADARVRACNNTSETIYFAVAGFDTESRGLQWRSKGWYKVEVDDCRDLTFSIFMPQHLFVYANNSSQHTFWTGDFLFCVHETTAFDLKGDRNCAGFGEGHAVKRFFHRRSGDGSYYVNFVP